MKHDAITVLITGTNGFLGHAFCADLLENGCKVLATDVHQSCLHDALNSNSHFSYLKLDVTSEAEIAGLLKTLKERNLIPNVLVNNACINPIVSKQNEIRESSRLENFEVLQFRKEFAVGIEGAILCSKIFGEVMNKSGKGNIINIASDLGVIAPDQRLYRKPNLPSELQPVKPLSYSVIKHAVIGLTKYLATYWPNVRCNSLSPGGAFNDQPEEFLEKIKERIPLNRMADRKEIAKALSFLVSDDSSYMNGSNLIVDGGNPYGKPTK